MAALTQVQLRGAAAPLAARSERARLSQGRALAPAIKATGLADDTPSVRPYTIRKGDTLESIAQKRGLKVSDLEKYNKGLKEKGRTDPGKTILLPTFALSERDREILKGIKPKGPRIYPMRKGENIQDVMKARGITEDEVKKLNPGIDLKKVKDGQQIFLPEGKYTKREKEMLSSVMPASSVGIPQFTLPIPGKSAVQIGIGLALGVAAYGFYVKSTKDWQEKN